MHHPTDHNTTLLSLTSIVLTGLSYFFKAVQGVELSKVSAFIAILVGLFSLRREVKHYFDSKKKS